MVLLLEDNANNPENIIKIYIPGDPVSKKIGVAWVEGIPRIITVKETIEYQDNVKYIARKAMQCRPLLGCPVFVKIFLHFRIPESWNAKKKHLAITGKIFPTNKPDVDNCVKAVLDGCTNAIWIDDCQVTDLYARKRYDDLPHTTVIITPLAQYEEQGNLPL